MFDGFNKIDQLLYLWVCIQRNKSIRSQRDFSKNFQSMSFQKSPKLETIQMSTVGENINKLWVYSSNGILRGRYIQNGRISKTIYWEKPDTKEDGYMIYVKSNFSNAICRKDTYFSIKLPLHLCPKPIDHMRVSLFLDSLFCSTDLSVYVFIDTLDDDYSSLTIVASQ